MIYFSMIFPWKTVTRFGLKNLTTSATFLPALVIGSLLFTGFLEIGCQRDHGPQPLQLDQYECAACRMIISNPRTAAQIQLPSGQTLWYDDIRCFLKGVEAHQSISNAWVKNFQTGDWIEYQKAQYYLTDARRTPMHSGIIAAKSPEKLNVAIQDTIGSWQTLISRYEEHDR